MARDYHETVERNLPIEEIKRPGAIEETPGLMPNGTA